MKIRGKGLLKQTENIAVREVGFDKFVRRSLAPNRYTVALLRMRFAASQSIHIPTNSDRFHCERHTFPCD